MDRGLLLLDIQLYFLNISVLWVCITPPLLLTRIISGSFILVGAPVPTIAVLSFIDSIGIPFSLQFTCLYILTLNCPGSSVVMLPSAICSAISSSVIPSRFLKTSSLCSPRQGEGLFIRRGVFDRMKEDWGS